MKPQFVENLFQIEVILCSAANHLSSLIAAQARIEPFLLHRDGSRILLRPMKFAAHIQTRRLSLRPISLSDFWFFSNLLGNDEVRRYLGGPVNWKERPARFKRYLGGVPKTGIWIVRSDCSSRAIGLLELGPHKGGQEFEVSYQFHPKGWGHGFAMEAVAAVIQHGLVDAGLTRIIAETQTANSASCRLLDCLGMREVNRVHRFKAEQIIFATH